VTYLVHKLVSKLITIVKKIFFVSKIDYLKIFLQGNPLKVRFLKWYDFEKN